MERLIIRIEDDVELQRLIAAIRQGSGHEYLRARPVLVDFVSAADEIVGDADDVQLLRSLLTEE